MRLLINPSVAFTTLSIYRTLEAADVPIRSEPPPDNKCLSQGSGGSLRRNTLSQKLYPGRKVLHQCTSSNKDTIFIFHILNLLSMNMLKKGTNSDQTPIPNKHHACRFYTQSILCIGDYLYSPLTNDKIETQRTQLHSQWRLTYFSAFCFQRALPALCFPFHALLFHDLNFASL